MRSLQPMTPQQVCEGILQDEKTYNNEHHILRSENAIADRLLARSIDLKDTYEELHEKLHAHPLALKDFIGLVLSTAALWSPEKIKEARQAREDLINVNRQIARQATELARLLAHRSELHNTSGFYSSAHYHVCDVIEAASRENSLFEFYVQEGLDALRSQFDLRYWPSLERFIQELASDADKAVIAAADPLTAAATAATRSSLADFFKALFTAIKENSAAHYGRLPRGFKLTDRALASLANCALDLAPEIMVDETYVKRLRQRERDGAK